MSRTLHIEVDINDENSIQDVRVEGKQVRYQDVPNGYLYEVLHDDNLSINVEEVWN